MYVTQTPLCDDQALDEFTTVAEFGPSFKPKYITAFYPGASKETLLSWEYDLKTDILAPLLMGKNGNNYGDSTQESRTSDSRRSGIL